MRAIVRANAVGAGGEACLLARDIGSQRESERELERVRERQRESKKVRAS